MAFVDGVVSQRARRLRDDCKRGYYYGEVNPIAFYLNDE